MERTSETNHPLFFFYLSLFFSLSSSSSSLCDLFQIPDISWKKQKN